MIGVGRLHGGQFSFVPLYLGNQLLPPSCVVNVHKASPTPATPHANAEAENDQVPFVSGACGGLILCCACGKMSPPQAPEKMVLDHFQPPHLPGLCQARALLCGPRRPWAGGTPFLDPKEAGSSEMLKAAFWILKTLCRGH